MCAQPAAFDKNSCGRAHVIINVCSGGRVLIKTLSTHLYEGT